MGRKNKKKEYKREVPLYKGHFEITRSGMGFVIVSGLEKDIIIRPNDFNRAFHGDHVRVEVTKGDKKLKAIPAKLKKEKELIELTSYRKTMREQWSRSRKGLEEAMVRGDAFTLDEMTNLFEHPVISKHLEKLVFVSEWTKRQFFKDLPILDSEKCLVIYPGSNLLKKIPKKKNNIVFLFF